MNKIKLILLSIFLISISLVSCEDEKQDGPFEIYFLSDSILSYLDIEDMSLSNIKLEANPVISPDDIIEYRIQYIPDNPIHYPALFLNENKQDKLGDTRKPFVVMANYKKIYIGEYWPQPSGGDLPNGVIMVHMTENRYHIESVNESDNDLINDDNIISALKYSGIEIVYEDISD